MTVERAAFPAQHLGGPAIGNGIDLAFALENPCRLFRGPFRGGKFPHRHAVARVSEFTVIFDEAAADSGV